MEIDFISTLWGLWVHRNEVIFKGTSTNPMRIMAIIRDHSCRARREKRDIKGIIGSRNLNMEDRGVSSVFGLFLGQNQTEVNSVLKFPIQIQTVIQLNPNQTKPECEGENQTKPNQAKIFFYSKNSNQTKSKLNQTKIKPIQNYTKT